MYCLYRVISVSERCECLLIFTIVSFCKEILTGNSTVIFLLQKILQFYSNFYLVPYLQEIDSDVTFIQIYYMVKVVHYSGQYDSTLRSIFMSFRL